jgi:hypothetical protein
MTARAIESSRVAVSFSVAGMETWASRKAVALDITDPVVGSVTIAPEKDSPDTRTQPRSNAMDVLRHKDDQAKLAPPT